MFFDPISTWLVSLIADGSIVSSENYSSRPDSEYTKERIKTINGEMNAQIRNIKKKYGTNLPTLAYEAVQIQTTAARNSLISWGIGEYNIKFTEESMDYLIDLFEACAEFYKEFTAEEFYDKYREFKDAASRLRTEKKECIIRMQEEKERKAKEDNEYSKKAEKVIFIVCLLFVIIFTLSASYDI